MKPETEKKQIPQNITKTEQIEFRMNQLLETNDTGILLVQHGKIIEGNQTAYKLLGISKKEPGNLILDNFLMTSFFDNHHRKRELKEIHTLIMKGEKNQWTTFLAGKKKSPVLVTLYYHVISRQDDLIQVMIKEENVKCPGITLENKSARKGKVPEARLSNPVLNRISSYHEFFNAAKEGLLIQDTKSGIVLDVNNALLSMFEITREEIINQLPDKINNWVTGFEKEQALRNFIRAVEEGEMNYEWYNRNRSDKYFWTEVHHKRVNVSGSSYLLTVIRDITERKKIEENLNVSENRFRNFVDITNDGIYYLAIDPPLEINMPPQDQLEYFFKHACFSEANNAWLRIHHIRDRKGIIGKPISVVYAKDKMPVELMELGTKFFSSNYRIVNAETLFKRSDGSINYYQNNIIGVVLKDKLKGIWHSMRDITELKLAEEALHHKTKLDRLVSRISTRFINLSQGKIDKNIEFSLGEICKATGSDAGFLCIFSNHSKTFTLSHFWHNQQVQIKTDRLFPPMEAKWLLEELEKSGLVLVRFKDKWTAQKKTHLIDSHKGFGVSLMRPVYYQDLLTGIIGLISAEPEFKWKPDDSVILKIVSEIFINAIQRKNVERTLIQSEERFRSILQHLTDIIWIVDKDTTITYESPSSSKIMGYKSGYLIGKKGIDFIHPEDRQGVMNDFQDVIYKKNDFIPTAFRGRHSDGHYIFMEALANNMIDHKTINGIIITCRDVTERKKTELKLVESEEKFRIIFETAIDGIFMLRADQVVDCNSAILKMFCCTRDQIIGEAPYGLSPEFQPDGLASKEKALEKINLAYSGSPQFFEWQHTRFDGSLFDAEISLNRIDLAGIIYLQAIVRDTTSRRAAEKALKDSEVKFRNIFNSSTDGIIIVGKDRHFRVANDTFLKRTGLDMKEIVKLTPADILPESVHSFINGKIEEIFLENEVPSHEVEIVNDDNSVITVEIHSQLVDYENEKALLSIIRDISERKQFDKKIIDTIIMTEEKERESFAKNLHDEIGPLLSSIKMYISSLESTTVKEKQEFIIRQLKDIMKEAIQSTKEISNDLSPHILSNYGLNAAVESFIHRITHVFQVNYTTNLGNMRFKELIEASIYRIVKELINNTLKHSNGTAINMSLKYSRGVLKLLYTDDGIGFPSGYFSKNEPQGMGISNIISRARSLNGMHNFFNNPEGGMGFECKLNVNRNH
jgi:PAS domain S-box-containing protein